MKTDFLSRLSKVRATGKDSWVACCPAHEDKSPSMTVRETDDGRVLIHCFAGCPPASILGAVGLDFDALFPEPLAPAKPMRRPFPAADVIECVAEEARIASVIASDMANGKTVSDADRKRLSIAAGRLESARTHIAGEIRRNG